MNKFLNFFTPNDRQFVELFETTVAVAHKMMEKLIEFTAETDLEKRKIIDREISNLEGKNDNITHEIFVLLSKNFITPFDREDIHALATSLDDICDYVYAASRKITLYNLDPNQEEIKQFCDISMLAIREVQKAVLNLSLKRNATDIIKNCIIQINSLENDADELYDKSIKKIFELNNQDTIDIIKKKDIYEVLERITDKCEDAGNVVESIMIKYL